MHWSNDSHWNAVEALENALRKMEVSGITVEQSPPRREPDFVWFAVELATGLPDQNGCEIDSVGPRPRIFIRVREVEYQRHYQTPDLLEALFKRSIESGYDLSFNGKQVRTYIRKNQAADASGQTWDFDSGSNVWIKGAIVT